ncbi:MAG: hypothetical protein ACOH1L_03180 [Thermomonas sp.]
MMANDTPIGRKAATMRAMMWLNTLEEGIRTGALVVSPEVGEAKADAIHETLTRFTEMALPAIRKRLGWAEGIYATRALRLRVNDLSPSEEYMLTRLLKESEALRDGMAGLRQAQRLLADVCCDDDAALIVNTLLAEAIADLDSVPMSLERRAEPGQIGVLMRSCDDAVEAIIDNLRRLRKEGFDEDDAEALAENCEELARRGRAIADHIRLVGPV